MVANFKDEIIQILNEKTFSREASSWNLVESWSAGYILSSQDGSTLVHKVQLQTFLVEKTLKVIAGHILGHWDNPRELTSDQISEKVWKNVWEPSLLKKIYFPNMTWNRDCLGLAAEQDIFQGSKCALGAHTLHRYISSTCQFTWNWEKECIQPNIALVSMVRHELNKNA